MMKELINPITTIAFSCALCFCLTAAAQKKDSLAPMLEFLRVSSAYKQAPLYLELEMKNSTNFITGEEDTLDATGTFYLLPGSSYMQLGEMEQLVTDSIALLVSSSLQRMIVNTNTAFFRNQMTVFAGSLLKDASAVTLSKKYRAEETTGGELSIIELNSRAFLYGTSLPKETVQMHYDGKTKKPVRLVSIKRMLFPVSDDDYQKLKSQPGVEQFLVDIEDKGHFLMKEQSTSFVYKKVIQDATIQIPVRISDRIVKNTNGEFEPVKAYENYIISTN